MTHIGYGLVNRSDGKMSSRLGNVILYDDLKNEIFEKLYPDSCRQKHPRFQNHQEYLKSGDKNIHTYRSRRLQ